MHGRLLHAKSAPEMQQQDDGTPLSPTNSADSGELDQYQQQGSGRFTSMCVTIFGGSSRSTRSYSERSAATHSHHRGNTLHDRIMRTRSKHFPLSATLLKMWPYLCIPPLLCVITLPLELLYYVLSCGCCAAAQGSRSEIPRLPSTPCTLSTANSPTPQQQLQDSDKRRHFQPPDTPTLVSMAPTQPFLAPLPMSALMTECSPVSSNTS